ncbi:hypothetical protein ACJX0J_019274, partial [Zea mays]
ILHMQAEQKYLFVRKPQIEISSFVTDYMFYNSLENVGLIQHETTTDLCLTKHTFLFYLEVTMKQAPVYVRAVIKVVHEEEQRPDTIALKMIASSITLKLQTDFLLMLGKEKGNLTVAITCEMNDMDALTSKHQIFR